MSDILSKENIAGLSVDELLELDVTQIAEVKPYAPKPTGVYGFTVESCGVVEVGEANAIEVEFKLHEVIELEEDTDENRELVGELPATYKEKYFIGGDSEYGLMTFRTVFSGLVNEGETPVIRELMERCVGAQGEGLLRHRKWVNKQTQEKQEGNQFEATAVDFS
jgi:hypothetical protein